MRTIGTDKVTHLARRSGAPSLQIVNEVLGINLWHFRLDFSLHQNWSATREEARMAEGEFQQAGTSLRVNTEVRNSTHHPAPWKRTVLTCVLDQNQRARRGHPLLPQYHRHGVRGSSIII